VAALELRRRYLDLKVRYFRRPVAAEPPRTAGAASPAVRSAGWVYKESHGQTCACPGRRWCHRYSLAAATLNRLLGIHITVAVAWQRASAGDWAAYAADISRRRETGNDTPA
jgi:hypothetical protein